MFFLVVIFILSALASPRWAEAADSEWTGKITVLQASSLSSLFRKAKEGFERKHPKVKVLLEPGASLVLIRKVTDLNKKADLIAVADHTLIPTFLMPAHVEKSVDFLTEQIALIMGDRSLYADSVTAQNWPEVLLKPNVAYGVSNPDTAPVGYRTMMVWKLAEQHYKTPGLYRQLRKKLQRRNIRQNASALLTLLKTGELDYVFNYASLAKQNGLRILPLPSQINLGDPKFAEQYRAVSVDIPGKKPGIKRKIVGEPIVYSMGLLKASANPEAAQGFIDFILGPQGRFLMSEMGMTPMEVR